MKANAIIKNLMSNRKITQGDLTVMMNMKSQSAVSGALGRDMKISTLLRFLNCMDCDVIVRDKTTGEEYQITE